MAGPTSVHEHWSGRLVFLLAAIGFAVGLGNIWKFPYIAGENGGGAFVIIYLVVAFVIGVPLVMTELMIGRRAGLSAIGSMRAAAKEAGAPSAWSLVGGLAILATFVILTFYAVVAGWAMDYFVLAIIGAFSGVDQAGSKEMYDNLLTSPLRLMFWQAVVMALVVFITSRGVSRGIEKAVLVLMPMLFALVLLLVGYGAVAGDFERALTFLFMPDFSQVTAQTFLIAVGQAFFSVGVAMAAMMTYGAYLPKHVSIPTSAVIIVGADTGVAILAGLAIFPIVFANGLTPGEGPGLIFQTLPLAFGNMPFGHILGIVFFLMLIAAALTSAIANFEPIVSWVEERQGMARKKGAIIAGVVVYVCGLGSVFSFNALSDYHPLDFIALFEGMTIYTVTDFIVSNIFLPLGALLMAIFAGWVMKKETSNEELGLSGGVAFKLWLFAVRVIAPAALLLMLYFGLTG